MMPAFFIEAPSGVRPDAKQKMMRKITAAIDEAYESSEFADTRIFVREYPPGNVALDGRVNAEPIKPVCFLEAPELANLQTKSAMAAKILVAVDEAYRDIANTDETLILMKHYPLEDSAWAGRLGSEIPDAVAYVEQLNP
jgi:phenylpyruvate tautomerase PptA (4-oxalocrotonate tautomerase family)